MIISGLDFGLIIALSYVFGIGSGITFICKNKENLMIRSRSRDNLSQYNHHQNHVAGMVTASTIPIIPSAPPPITKITVE